MGDNRAASVTLICTNPECKITYAAIVASIQSRRCICGRELKPVEPKAKEPAKAKAGGRDDME